MNKILVYGSQYEHINRGLLDYLTINYDLNDLQLILVVCKNNISSCYINHRISNGNYEEHINKLESCKRCIANQRSFLDYKEEVKLKIKEVELKEKSGKISNSLEVKNFINSFKGVFNEDIKEQKISFEGYLAKTFKDRNTLVSITRSAIGEYVSSQGSTDKINWGTIYKKVIVSQGIYNQIVNILKSEDIDKVCVFNGRFMIASIIIEAAKQRGIEYLTFESGHSWGPYASSYSIVENGRHQDFDARSYSLYNYYKEMELANTYKKIEAITSGKKMLYDRIFRKKQTGNYKLFVTSKYNEEERVDEEYILFLHTSLFEFFTTDDYLKNGRSDQVSIIEKLGEVIAETNTKLVVRFHPNSKYSDEIFKKRIIEVLIRKGVNYKVFHSEELVDTYKLIMGAKIVFGTSTMGIVESIFCSRPSYYFSPSIYKLYLAKRHIDINQQSWKASLKEIIDKPEKISKLQLEQACIYYAHYNWLFKNINYSNKGVEMKNLKIPNIHKIKKYGYYTT